MAALNSAWFLSVVYLPMLSVAQTVVESRKMELSQNNDLKGIGYGSKRW
jgi:hypothetical protein